MRSTLFASCLLGLSFVVVGCDDSKKADDTTPAVSPAPDAAGKDAMGGPAAEPTVTPAPDAAGKGAMGGPAAAPVVPTTPE